MAERSTKGLLALLPKAAKDGDALDRALSKEISNAIRYIEAHDDGQDNTQKALAKLREARRDLDSSSPLCWQTWGVDCARISAHHAASTFAV